MKNIYWIGYFVFAKFEIPPQCCSGIMGGWTLLAMAWCLDSDECIWLRPMLVS